MLKFLMSDERFWLKITLMPEHGWVMPLSDSREKRILEMIGRTEFVVLNVRSAPARRL